MMTDQKVIDVVSNMTSTTTKATVGASGTSLLAWLTHLDLVAYIGALVGVLGLFISLATFLVNLHYKKKEDKRAQTMHEIECEKIRRVEQPK